MKVLRKLAKYTLTVTALAAAAFVLTTPATVKAEEVAAVPEGMVAVTTQDGGTIVIPIEVQEKLLWENYTQNMINSDLMALRAQSDEAHWDAYLESLPTDVRTNVVKAYKAQGGTDSDKYLPKAVTPKTADAAEATDNVAEASTAANEETLADDAKEIAEQADEVATASEEENDADDADAASDAADANAQPASVEDKTALVNEKIKSLSEKVKRLNDSLDKITADTEYATGDNSEIIEEAAKYIQENPDIIDAIGEMTTPEELELADALGDEAAAALEALSPEDIEKLKNIADAGMEVVEQGKRLSEQFIELKKKFERLGLTK